MYARAFLLIAAVAVCSAADSAVQWSRWEISLTAAQTPEDPYRNVKLTGVFTGPGGQRIEAPGFWAGGKTFRLRVAFPSAGAWRWKTSCDPEEAGLHGRAGVVHISRVAGNNPLFRHGRLRVSANRRYLEHSDGTPFLWMGDTVWFASNASTDEWADYVADRARKRFSVLQLSAGRVPEGSDPSPFARDGTPDAAYWDDIDQKVRHANEQGLLVLIVGLGHPRRAEEEQFVSAPEYARYVAARFFGDHVIFSPNFDSVYKPQFDTVAETLRRSSSLHLITQHPNTRQGQNEIYVPKTYLDFSGLQSGHHGGRLENAYGAAREWPLALWAMKPVKPVINIEGMYDGRGNNEGNAWREKDVRKIGWISWLSGALGYTYGAGDVPPKVPEGHGAIWRFNQDPETYDYWRKALAWPSAAQMTILRDFFAAVPWWDLEPAHDLLAPSGASNLQRPVFAATSNRGTGAAYLPAGGAVALDLSSFPAGVRATWMDPQTGRRHPARAAGGSFTAPPGGEDWVLLLRGPK